MVRWVFLLLLVIQGNAAIAQQFNWEQYLTEIYENEEEAAVQEEEAYEHLTELARQPLDINKVGVEELMQIPALDQNQINDILEYRHRYGNLRSIEELAMIESIDRRQRLYLSCFLKVYEEKESMRIAHDVTLTLQTPTYYRAGDMKAPAYTYLGKNKYAGKYLGDPTQHSLRYSLTVGKDIAFNITGSKSAGEPFGGNGNRWGYDQYAFNVSVRNKGMFKQIVAGHFRGQFGMGLIMNNNFTMGKQGMLSSMGRRLTAFTPHSSTSDSKHMQGLAATIKITNGLSLSAFFSYRHIDATLNADKTISTVLTSGYHRTEIEMAKKNNSTIMTTGAHMGYDGRIHEKGEWQWNVGVSAIYSYLNREINPTYSKTGTVSQGRMYRLYYPYGDRFWNVSADYRLRWRELVFNGETAMDGKGNPATINSITWRSPWGVTFMALQRYYSYQYNALYGSSFGESSSVKNESGLYLGAQWNIGRIVMDAYSDIAYFPWYKYLVSGSSYSWDNSVMGTLNREKWTFSLRYRLKMKQRDKTKDGKKQLLTKYDHRLRFLALYNKSRWSLRTQVEGCTLSFDETTKGFILTQSGSYKTSGKLEVYALAAYFNTDDYDSRLYIYERGMKYSFGSTSYYGHGLRAALLVRYDPLKWLTVQGKVGHTRYFDRKTIGTAERLIFSSYCTDIYLQLLLKL
ncbi:MAG: helix-hairpin-helix domain-containing protein [Prevotella sp.]|nr:helix-hairpin-helix domain-containing protein [Prevotella sp.]